MSDKNPTKLLSNDSRTDKAIAYTERFQFAEVSEKNSFFGESTTPTMTQMSHASCIRKYGYR